MLRVIRQTLQVPWYLLALLFLTSLGAALSESIGVSLLVPLLEYAERSNQTPEVASGSILWIAATKTLNFFHLPVSLGSLLVLCLIPILLKQVFIYANLTFTARAQFMSIAKLQEKCFDSIIRARIDYLRAAKTASFIGTLTLEINRAGQIISFYFRLMAAEVMLALYFAIIVYLSAVLTAMIAGTALLIQFVIRGQMIVSKLWGDRVSQGNSSLGTIIAEALNAVRLIKLHNMEAGEINKLACASRTLAIDQVRLRRINAGVQVIIEPMLIVGAFSIVYVGIATLGMRLAELGVFLLVLMRMLPLVKEVNSLRQELAAYSPSCSHVRDVIRATTVQRSQDRGRAAFPPLRNGVTFENVSYYYDSGAPILDNVSIMIPAQKTTAVVGHSGAGKSTIADLLVGLKEASGGQIRFDDMPADHIDWGSHRRAVALVSQDPIILNDTFFNNLTYGLASRDRLDLELMLDMCHLSGVVAALPEGLNTKIGEGGVALSGGERQRLCLARALLRRPKLLVLDEPTSALDPESERYVHDTLNTIRHSLTMVIITHKIATIKDADQILVLEKGRIVEAGSHGELIGGETTYHRLFGLTH